MTTKNETTLTVYSNVPISSILKHKKYDDDIEELPNFVIVNDFTWTAQVIYDYFVVLGTLIIIFLVALISIYMAAIPIYAEQIENPIFTLINAFLKDDTSAGAQSQCEIYTINTCSGGSLDDKLRFTTN